MKPELQSWQVDEVDLLQVGDVGWAEYSRKVSSELIEPSRTEPHWNKTNNKVEGRVTQSSFLMPHLKPQQFMNYVT
jgi:hypothetical protein